DGDNRTLNYMPVGINDWYFLSVLPNHIVASRAMELTKQAFVLGGALLLIVVIMWFYMNRLRRRGQTDLAEVHRELLTIYNTIPGGVFKCQLDEDFTLIDANDGLFKDIGYTREELKLLFDNKLVRLVSPEAAQRMKDSLQRQRETGETSRDEVQLVGKDGTKKWVL
ncbi:MAG: PAS domain-containing protein, partial [Oscillospiraceae bacterium]